MKYFQIKVDKRERIRVGKYLHGEENVAGTCAKFLKINNLSECCTERDDDCYMNHFKTACYCDKHATSDACSDADDVCGLENRNYTEVTKEKIKKRTYGEECIDSSECDSTGLLTCPTSDGESDCPIISYAFHCDCPSGYFWDIIGAACCKYFLENFDFENLK